MTRGLKDFSPCLSCSVVSTVEEGIAMVETSDRSCCLVKARKQSGRNRKDEGSIEVLGMHLSDLLLLVWPHFQ